MQKFFRYTVFTVINEKNNSGIPYEIPELKILKSFLFDFAVEFLK